jgi:Gpi18-like mannosyltransferase
MYFANIPWSILHERFTKHGLMNKFFLLSGLAGTVILLLDWWFTYSENLAKSRRGYFYTGIVALAALLLRLSFFDFESSDYTAALSKWYDRIKEGGGFSALAQGNFSDYNATYLYIMAFLTYLPLHKLYAIKVVSVIFDYSAAFVAYQIVRNHFGKSSFYPLAAFTAVLFSPTVLFNASFWAQCDVIYSSFLLASVSCFTAAKSSRKKILAGLVLVSIAFTFKLQSVFFVIPIFWLYLRGKIFITDIFILPVVWLLSILPNWLLGRDLMNLLLIYGHQVLNYPYLTLNAANIYQFLPSAPYEIFVKAGIAWTAVACLFFAIFLNEKGKKIPLNTANFLTIALFSLLLLPFLLPKMHERYFFAADLFSVVWAFLHRKSWYISPVIILASLLTYIPFLFNTDIFPMWVPAAMMFFALIKIGLHIIKLCLKNDFGENIEPR